MSPEGKDVRVSLRTNRIPVVTVYNGAASSFNSATGSALLTLAKDDIVYLFIEKGEIYESNQVNRAFTTFSGFQLSEKRTGGFFSSLIGRNGLPMAGQGAVAESSPQKGTNNGTIPRIATLGIEDEEDRIYTLLNSGKSLQSTGR
jgi:hypothetical protein